MFSWVHTFERSNKYWRDNQEANLEFLKERRLVTQNRFDIHGYIYMNELYEAFGLRWHPEYFNPVFTKDSVRSLDIEFSPLAGTSDILIYINH